MKQISLADAYNALSECDAVIWNHSMLCLPAVFELSDYGNDEFLILSTDDEDGQTFSENFMQDGNEIVCVSGSVMWLTNTQGDSVEIKLLFPSNSTFDKYAETESHKEE